MPPYIYQRGETISLALDALSGDPGAVSAISAQLKAVAPGRLTIAPDAAVAANFEITPRAAFDDLPAGWTLTIPASVSAMLDAGFYGADARLEVAGGVIITDQVALRIRDAVTA
ncbi:MAG: hypothetical protein AABY88_02795 [Pseudomonadota bacterium]